MSNLTNRPIGQILVENGTITEEQLQTALKAQKASGKRLGDTLVEMGFITEKQQLEALSERSGSSVVDAPVYQVSKEAIRLIPEAVARRYNILPLAVKNGQLSVATDDPLNFYAFEDLRAYAGMEIVPVLSERAAIRSGIDHAYSDQNARDVVEDINKEYESVATMDLSGDFINIEDLDDAPVVKLVNNIIVQAYTQNASDIHIEPYADHTLVRIRVDGDLIEQMTISSAVHSALITRLKIMAGMNIAERRLPLDGRFEVDVASAKVDIRAATLPTIHGEKMVLRLLADDSRTILPIKELGISPYNYERLERLIKSPNGIVLVTGPTGSGKSTTLYSVLNQISNPKINIVTVEDPVEKTVAGINQMQVNPKAGLTFATAMRSILRQDPDIIMLGEVRDTETASIAIRAAITGHLVLSTLHTNDAPSSVARLLDMGVEPYLVASSVKGVVAQRLVKRICPYCKTEIIPTQEDELMLQGLPVPRRLYRGAGCARCGQTGYHGRTSVHEIMLVDSELRDRIIRRDGTDSLREYAHAHGMTFLRDNLYDLLANGETTLEELARVTYTIE